MAASIDTGILIQAILVNGIIALLAYFGKTVSKSGILGGLIVGIPIYTFMGWQGFVILFSMFLIGTIATKWGYQKKKEMGLAEKNEGQRGISNVLGKCLAGVLFAFLAYLYREYPNFHIIFRVAFVGSFAAGTFDTISSELGQLYGKKYYTLIPFRSVSNGTEGAISLEGTFAGLISSLIIVIISLLIKFFGFFPSLGLWDDTMILIIPILIGPLLSNLLESFIGSLFESKGIINKFTSNLINTLLGGLFSIIILNGSVRLIDKIFTPYGWD